MQPAMQAPYGMPQAFTWNMGTTGRHESLSSAARAVTAASTPSDPQPPRAAGRLKIVFS